MGTKVNCYEDLTSKFGKDATRLKATFYAIDAADGKIDGKFEESVSEDAKTSMDLCDLARQFMKIDHSDNDVRARRFAQTANGFLSLVNLVNSKKDQVWPIRNELISMQIGFVTFFNEAIGISNDDWFTDIAPPSGKYRFWEPALKNVFSKKQWINTARTRTLPSP